MATPEIHGHIIGAFDYGVSQVEKFVEDRVIPDPNTGRAFTKHFLDPPSKRGKCK